MGAIKESIKRDIFKAANMFILLGLMIAGFSLIIGVLLGSLWFLKNGQWFVPTLLDLLQPFGIEYISDSWSDWKGLERMIDWFIADASILKTGPIVGILVSLFGVMIYDGSYANKNYKA